MLRLGAKVATATAAVMLVLALPVAPQSAHALPLTILACDAAGGQTQSWAVQAGSVDAYKACPSSSLPGGYGGLGTRLGGRTFATGQYSRLWFYAPAGTTITKLRWAGRVSRTSCSYAAELRAQGGAVDARLMGAAANAVMPCAYDTGALAATEDFPIPAGTTRLLQNTQCGAATCPSSGAAFRTYYAAVTLNDPTAPSLAIAGGGLSGAAGWVRGTQSLAVSASDVTGIRLVRMQIAGWPHPIDSAKACNYASASPCTAGNGATSLGFPTQNLPADGARQVTVTAYDAASNATTRTATVRLDNHAPLAPELSVEGASAWRSQNTHGLRWGSPEGASADRAPITRVRYRLCPAGSQVGCSSDRSVSGSFPTVLTRIAVPGAGQWDARVALVDSAGNGAGGDAQWSGPARLRYDPDPPRLRIDPQDPANPVEVSVRATDVTSGIAGGQIEVRREGTSSWTELETRFDGGRLRADIDDERLPDGAYLVRARASDRAGNEASTAPRSASRRLPVRIATRLRAGVPKVVKKRVKRGGRVRRVRRIRLTGSRRVRFGGRIHVRGVLATRDGQPLEDTAVTVYARPTRLGAPETAVGLVRTNREGRFRYRAKARESRTLRFSYRGSRRVRGSSARVRVRVPARVTLGARPRSVINGEAVTLSGRVLGRPIPFGGKQVVIQAFSRGRWRTFLLARTDQQGRYSLSYRFDGTTGKVVYPLRALVTREPTFAFDRGTSRAARVTVRGL